MASGRAIGEVPSAETPGAWLFVVIAASRRLKWPRIKEKRCEKLR